MNIKPIETIYGEYTFRSRLEARWAVFFDRIGIEWRYEDEGYQTSYGHYLPDFWLPNVYMRHVEAKGVLFEVKPASYLNTGHDALAEVGQQLHVGAILAIGFDYSRMHGWNELYQISGWWDNNMMIYPCACKTMKFDYDTGTYYACPKCGREQFYGVHEYIQAAYDVALAYRFW